MSTSNTRATHLSSIVGKIVMALAFAAVIGGLSMVPALGQDNDRRQEQQERGRHERERHDEQRGRHERTWHDERGRHERERHDERGRRVYQPYGYSAPIYTPPPVVYGPYPSPGISLFFPFHFR